MDGPYREPKPIPNLIPPDRRRQRAALLVIGSMIAGAVIFQSARSLLESPCSSTIETTELPRATQHVPNPNHIPRVTLHGPDGTMTLPTGSRVVINVWLQGCQDCMPAFEAMRSINEHGGLRVQARVINIAYGEADPAWAARYGVRDNLLYDSNGTSIVKPLGISTFTTFVVDSDGVILHRDRPDQAGYADRVRGLVDGVDPPGRGELTSDEVQRVVSIHRTAIRDVCWERSPLNTPPPTGTTKAPSVRVTASIIVGANGDVVSIASSGSDPTIASCVENQVRSWKFPAHNERSATVQIPFVFTRESN